MTNVTVHGMSQDSLLRLKDVERLTGIKSTHIYRLQQLGRFPRRINLSPRCSVYRESEIREWIAGQVAARDSGSASPRASPRKRAVVPEMEMSAPTRPTRNPRLSAPILGLSMSVEFHSQKEIVAASRPWRNVCGIYFLIKSGRVRYVGQSLRIFERLCKHAEKDFDRVAFIECPAELLNRYESFYIHTLSPPDNGTLPNGGKLAPLTLEALLKGSP